MKFIVNRFSTPTTATAINLAGDHCLSKSKLKYQSGLGLVEIMVALAIGIFLVMGLMQMLITSKQSYQSSNHLSQLQEDGRVATNLVVTDLKRAGYMGGNSERSKIEGSLGIVEPDSSCNSANTNWGRMIEDPVFGLNDTSAGYDCITNYLTGDVVTIRHASPWLETGALSANRLYVRSSLFRGTIFVGSDSNAFINDVPKNANNIRELQAQSYFVGESLGWAGRGINYTTCSNEAIPALFRVHLDETGLPTTEELLQGVEQFQVQYTDGQQYFNADDLSMDDWEGIQAVRVWMLIRTVCPEANYTDSQTYEMGDLSYTPNDNFRRQLYSNVVSIRN